MSFLALMVFMICPIMVLPFVFIGLKKDKRHRKIYLAIIAFLLALFSYSYQPTSIEDLYRHQSDAMQYQYSEIDTLIDDIHNEPEQLAIAYKFMIGKTGNPSLLQFFTSAVSFFILLYLLNAYTEKNEKLRGWKLVGVWLFVLSGFYYIVITSNIFYTLALEIFSLGVYMDYARNRKIVGWVFYILPVFIHTCAILPLALIVLYKLLRSRINTKNVVLLVILILSIHILLSVVAANINLPIITEISNLYRWYFNNEGSWSNLHTPSVLLLYMSKLVPVVLAYKVSKMKDPVSDFALFMAIAIVILFFQTTFSIRYIHVAVLCGLPVLFRAAQDKKYGQIFCVLLYAFAIPHFIYQVRQMVSRTDWGSFENVQRIFVTNLITTLTKG